MTPCVLPPASPFFFCFSPGILGFSFAFAHLFLARTHARTRSRSRTSAVDWQGYLLTKNRGQGCFRCVAAGNGDDDDAAGLFFRALPLLSTFLLLLCPLPRHGPRACARAARGSEGAACLGGEREQRRVQSIKTATPPFSPHAARAHRHTHSRREAHTQHTAHTYTVAGTRQALPPPPLLLRSFRGTHTERLTYHPHYHRISSSTSPSNKHSADTSSFL